jgi:AmiR/NasT family two-component response regulator
MAGEPGSRERAIIGTFVGLADTLARDYDVAELQQRTVAGAEERAAQLQHALDSRIIIEQAKGVLAQQHRVTPEAAWEALRTYARSHRLRVHEVSKRVVDGTAAQVLPPG